MEGISFLFKVRKISSSSGIYTITNLITGKIYIGYAVNFNSRYNSHKCRLESNKHANQHLQRAFNIDGAENLIFEILEECDIKFLASQEHYWVNMLDARNHKIGYNIKPTHPDGRPRMTEDTKQKLREANLGKKHTEEHKRKIGESSKGRMLGRKHTDEAKKKISEAHKGKRIGINNPFYGKHLSEETKLRMSESKKGKYLGKDNPNFGNKWNDEQRNNLSKYRKKSIIQMDLEGNFIKEWDSALDASIELNINRQNITACCTKRAKTTGGFKWKYNI